MPADVRRYIRVDKNEEDQNRAVERNARRPRFSGWPRDNVDGDGDERNEPEQDQKYHECAIAPNEN